MLIVPFNFVPHPKVLKRFKQTKISVSFERPWCNMKFVHLICMIFFYQVLDDVCGGNCKDIKRNVVKCMHKIVHFLLTRNKQLIVISLIIRFPFLLSMNKVKKTYWFPIFLINFLDDLGLLLEKNRFLRRKKSLTRYVMMADQMKIFVHPHFQRFF
jgi:hypothetical protein